MHGRVNSNLISSPIPIFLYPKAVECHQPYKLGLVLNVFKRREGKNVNYTGGFAFLIEW